MSALALVVIPSHPYLVMSNSNIYSGRLSLINIELNLFQGLESGVHWSDLVRRLPGYADWFVAVDSLIVYILMIPNKGASGSR